MAKFYLNKDQIVALREKIKIQNYLSSLLGGRMYIKASKDEMILYIEGNLGAFKINLNVSDPDDFDPVYFSVDVSKWMNTLDKYSLASRMSFQVKGNSLVIGEDGSRDTISLGIIYTDPDSDEAHLENFIEVNSENVLTEIELTDNFIRDVECASSMFMQQGSNNSIGVCSDKIIYSDRATVLIVKLEENPFKYDQTSFIPIHKNVINLLPFLCIGNESARIYTNDDFSRFYFEDNISKGILASKDCEIEIPTEEEIDGISPQDGNEGRGYFKTNLSTLRVSLDFFKGFYEGSQWRPITFENNSGEVNLRYKSATSNIFKSLDTNESSGGSYSFDLCSDIVEKITNKAIARLGSESEVVFDYDSESVGSKITIYQETSEGNNKIKYQAILAKLEN